jgi:hypothetical protein
VWLGGAVPASCHAAPTVDATSARVLPERLLAQAAPVNDNFEARTALSGSSQSVPGSNVGATFQQGEPVHAGFFGGSSVWWTWTAPADGAVQLTLTNSSLFSPLLAVYTGTQLSALTPIASVAFSNLLTFTATAGTTYQIAVDGANFGSGASVGNFTFNLQQFPPPPNNNFVDGAPIDGALATVNGTNLGATKEPGEPNHGGNTGGASVWYNWTAPFSGLVTLDTFGSNFSTLLGVYTGEQVAGLTPIVSSSFSSPISFSATAGTTYRIAVDGFNFGSGASTGNLVLNLSLIAPPANDNFASAPTLLGDTVSTTGTNVGASAEPGEPAHAGITATRSVWWTWTAPVSSPVSIDTFGSSFDTVLAVYTGNAVNALSPIASNDQFNGNQSKVTFNAVAGTTYRIVVDGFFGSSGTINLALGPVPTNDNFAARAPLPSVVVPPISRAINTARATKEFNEPSHAGNIGGKSVWWTWAPARSRRVTISTRNSAFDTLLAVYTGTDLSNLTVVAANDDAGGAIQSQVTFDAVAGRVYQIVLDGADGAGGEATLVLAGSAVTNFAADFDGDGRADRLTRDPLTGRLELKLAPGAQTSLLPPMADLAWEIGAVADFDGDGRADILWRHYGTGANQLWLMNGARRRTTVELPQAHDTDWQIVGTTDRNGDGRPDILWRNGRTPEKTMVWLMQGTRLLQALPLRVPAARPRPAS